LVRVRVVVECMGAQDSRMSLLLLLLVLRSSLRPGDGGGMLGLGLVADGNDALEFFLAIERRRIVPGDAHLL